MILDILSLDSVHEALFTALVFTIMFNFWKKFKRKKIWIIEDSEIDVALFKVRLKLDTQHFDVQYLTGAEMLAQRMLKFQKPDAVLVDYFLGRNILGDKVIKFCDNNGIESVLITGYDGEIAGMRGRVIKKTGDDSFFRAVENWIKQVTHYS